MVAGRHNHIHASEHAFGGIDDLDLAGYGTHTGVRFAKPTGNNSNDGLSWGTAKADILGAYDALSSDGGTIYFTDGTYADASNTDRGLWIAGPNDPAYGSLPTGWRQQKRLRLVGVGQNHTPNGITGPQAWMFASNGADRNKPTLWFTGTNVPINIERARIAYPAVGIRIGIDTGQTQITNTSGITFRECGVELNNIVNNGPGVEFGYCFWINFFNCVINGCRVAHTITAASITSGTTARFTIGTHALEAGDTVNVTGVTPAGYNGYWAVSAVGATTFDADIGSSPGAGSVFGTAQPVINFRGAALSLNTITGALAGETAGGLIFVEDTNLNGGGFQFGPSGTTTWGGITMKNVTHEGGFGTIEPPTMHVRAAHVANGVRGEVPGSGGAIHCEMVGQADGEWPDGAIIVDGRGGVTASHNVLAGYDSGAVTGPGAIAINQAPADRRTSGVTANAVIGHSPGAARAFGPAPVLGTNLVSHDTSTWTGITTTGLPAPDGSTSAARLTAGGSMATVTLANPGITLAVGDWIVGGVWRRFHSGTPHSDSNQDNAVIGFPHTDNHIRGLSDTNNIFFGRETTNYLNDGGWDWEWFAGEVVAAGTPSTNLAFSLRAAANNSIDYAYPVMMRVTAASSPDPQEMRQLARYMRAWPDGATAGSAAMMRGQKLEFAPDVNLYRSAANVLKTDDNMEVGSASLALPSDFSTITVGNTGATDISPIYARVDGVNWRIRVQSSNDHLQFQEDGVGTWLAIEKTTGKLLFGGAYDTNLYRSAADTLKTDDAFIVAGTIKQNTTEDVISTGNASWIDLTDGGGTTLHSHAGGAGVASDTIWDAKGDIAAATAADTAVRVAVGANGTVLTADSGAAPGVSWQSPGAATHPGFITHAKFGVG